MGMEGLPDLHLDCWVVCTACSFSVIKSMRAFVPLTFEKLNVASSPNLDELTIVNDVSVPLTSQQWKTQKSQSKQMTLWGLRSRAARGRVWWLVFLSCHLTSKERWPMLCLMLSHIAMATWAFPRLALVGSDNKKASKKNTWDSYRLWRQVISRLRGPVLHVLLKRKPLSREGE